jgi:hypothetical protein
MGRKSNRGTCLPGPRQAEKRTKKIDAKTERGPRQSDLHNDPAAAFAHHKAAGIAIGSGQRVPLRSQFAFRQPSMWAGSWTGCPQRNGNAVCPEAVGRRASSFQSSIITRAIPSSTPSADSRTAAATSQTMMRTCTGTENCEIQSVCRFHHPAPRVLRRLCSSHCIFRKHEPRNFHGSSTSLRRARSANKHSRSVAWFEEPLRPRKATSPFKSSSNFSFPRKQVLQTSLLET